MSNGTTNADMPLLFAFFNEIGIINQLSTTQFNRRLPDGLHVSHFSVLNHLSRRDFPETPAMLADAFQVSKGTMTHTITTLAARGFVELEPHPKDGRSKYVRLTDVGRVFVRDAVAKVAPTMAKLNALVDLDAVAKMLPELAKIRAVLDENRDI